MSKVDDVLAEYGTTHADQAGIKLADKPQPLYQLLVLTTLMSARIGTDIAIEAAKELWRAGWKTPRAMRDSEWIDRVHALGRGHYVRYDESTARYLVDSAEFLRERYRDDLRGLAEAAGGSVKKLEKLLTEFPRIGPTGAQIFCQEVQAVWPWVRPYFDKRALTGAGKAGLPGDPAKLADRVSGSDLARLAAALVQVNFHTKKR
ncbi:endonuclease [Amycolatopsis sp. FDAARGOS 1241]|uniref:endonuclease n=1 Tax=Amycolatopsis sp. FDAARGOS 1241 TaxID=2778070 RepID=UPI00194EC14E|nr:endonuclease [Amycolatopsis sp. FDAARGOS 1241]QRP49569.1 endonuclease [Amycolatopsis sp. FDAARGOS 1241]